MDTLSKLTSTGCGTLITMAPEVLEGKRYTFSADIWSLGVILYELVTGNVPFYAISVEKLKQKVFNLEYNRLPKSTVDEIREIVEGCLKVEPK